MNRRYGIIKQVEIDKYNKEKLRYDESKNDFDPRERLDYNILDEKDHNSRGVLPSDKYDYLIQTPATSQDIDNPWNWNYQTLVRKFRGAFNFELQQIMPKHGKAPKISFDDTIRQYRLQLKNAKDESEKYRVVLKAMQGVDQLTGINHQKALMFHEMIQAPLNTLYVMWTIVNQFMRRSAALDIDAIENIIRTDLKMQLVQIHIMDL